MRTEQIEELIKLVEKSEISELEICEGRRKIRIAKAGAVPAASLHATQSATPPPATNPPQVTAPAESASGTAPGDKLASNLKQITSPMVGTFYRAPSPDAEPFVEVGQAVTAGQTVCIVEAMKLLNEIGSDYNGVIRQVLIENAQPVEYGQPLFLVETK